MFSRVLTYLTHAHNSLHMQHLIPRWQDADKHRRLKIIMSDRPDLINSEMNGVAFNSVDQCFKQSLLKQMFQEIIPLRIEFSTRFFVTIDPAAGGEHSDFAMVSFTCSHGIYKVCFISAGIGCVCTCVFGASLEEIFVTLTHNRHACNKLISSVHRKIPIVKCPTLSSVCACSKSDRAHASPSYDSTTRVLIFSNTCVIPVTFCVVVICSKNVSCEMEQSIETAACGFRGVNTTLCPKKGFCIFLDRHAVPRGTKSIFFCMYLSLRRRSLLVC